ncbi:hypothetical protein [Donghicola sp. XS_ASV15]|uniref:hypothetical protein n=1 Tax=Donghicola sp. XS_ASV15 TaxID=3241295 RepID=UPI003518B689
MPRDTLLSFDKAMKRIKGPQIPAIFSIFPRRHFFAVFREIKEAVFEILRDKACIEGGLILAHHRIGAVLKKAPFENETLRLCAHRINGIEAHRFVIRAPDPVARLARQFAHMPPQRFAMGNSVALRQLFQLLSELQNGHIGRGQTMARQLGGAFAQPRGKADPLGPARISGFGTPEPCIDELALQVPHRAVPRRRGARVP